MVVFVIWPYISKISSQEIPKINLKINVRIKVVTDYV